MNTLVTNGSRFNLLPLSNFSREMNRWIDELASESKCTGCAPVSIWESDSHYHFEFDLPGVVADDLELKIVENVLHVTANRPQKSDVNYLRQERSFGRIERQFTLPTRVDENDVDAELTNGALKVSVAKAPEAQVKKIEIKSDS